ncbi:MAG TPA: hypothetical protein DCY48_02170 [Candidatus Magasanikbacteria bacterium]|nr:hypothetical protein [Candidatus Magasanikbacteria bacterium]
MRHYCRNKKEEADHLLKMSIGVLKQWGYLGGSFRSGTVTWTYLSSGNKSSVGLQTFMDDEKPNARLTYTQTDRTTGEKTDFNYGIPFTSTSCNLGGKRYWFQCPWYRNGVYCGRRVGVLYKAGDYFACRHCCNLSYASKNENRRFKLFEYGKILDLEQKIENLESKISTKFYRGKPTNKYRRLIALKKQYYGFDFEAAVAEMEKRLGS